MPEAINSVSRPASGVLRSLGPTGLLKELRHRAYTRYYENRLGVETRGFFVPDGTKPGSKPYGAIGYEHIFWALDRIPFPAGQVELVDYGAGKGRALAAAAMRPYRSVTGVELSPSLAADARRNMDALRQRKAQSVVVHEGDATEFAIPPTTNVFYFFNPFEGEPLQRVMVNIRESIRQHPRPAFLIYFNHGQFDRMVAKEAWIRKVYDGTFYPQFSCGLYQI